MQAVSVAIILVTIGACTPCSIWPGWRPISPNARIRESDIAFRGTVTDVQNEQPIWGYNSFYKAVFDVECVYKGSIPKTVTVHGFGFAHGLCVANEVQVAQTYIILAQGSPEDLGVTGVNIQSGAMLATSDLRSGVEAEFSCQQEAGTA